MLVAILMSVMAHADTIAPAPDYVALDKRNKLFMKSLNGKPNITQLEMEFQEKHRPEYDKEMDRCAQVHVRDGQEVIDNKSDLSLEEVDRAYSCCMGKANVILGAGLSSYGGLFCK